MENSQKILTGLRNNMENIINNIWISGNQKNKIKVTELVERYKDVRKEMEDLEIPKEDITNYNKRIYGIINLLEKIK